MPAPHTPKPLDLIAAIRDSAPYMHVVYTWGSCYKLYKILKTVYPDAMPYYRYSYDDSHMITKIGRKYYDINGEVKDVSRFMPFDEAHFPGYTHFAKDWVCKLSNLIKYIEESLKEWPQSPPNT